MSERTGPLSDVTVVDCTMALAGPFGAAILADLGANVIKVEPPSGDASRSLPPLPEDYANVNAAEPAGCDYGGYFASVNRNKRSIVLDLKTPAGRETLLQLCDKADALIENMRAGVMDKLGVGYDVLCERNPALVYGCVRGFGDPRTGESPYASWPAYDIVAQSMGGIAHLTGPDSGNGFPAGASVGDLYPGTLMALGVVSAIHHARRTGEGQFVDIGMYDAVLFLSEAAIVNFGYSGEVLGPRGAQHPNLCPFGIFPASDGGVAIAAPGPGHWQALCEIMGREDLITDEKTKNIHLRVKHRFFVQGVIADWTAQQTKQNVVAALAGKVPCGPVNTAADMFADPHVQARGMINKLDLPGDHASVSIAANPIRYTATPTNRYRRPPKLGEHTDEILEELGLKGGR
jgi:crotonobetainyl-CoA:carnitine CoA-transferase CaiB-like acyl-CoA transferase